MKARKKPVTVEAWQWLYSCYEEPAPTWVIDALHRWPAPNGANFEPKHPSGPRIAINTPEGVMLAKPGDWIIQGVKGELYPCKPDVFEQTYEIVEE